MALLFNTFSFRIVLIFKMSIIFFLNFAIFKNETMITTQYTSKYQTETVQYNTK